MRKEPDQILADLDLLRRRLRLERKSLLRTCIEMFLTWTIVSQALGQVVAFALTHGVTP